MSFYSSLSIMSLGARFSKRFNLHFMHRLLRVQGVSKRKNQEYGGAVRPNVEPNTDNYGVDY